MQKKNVLLLSSIIIIVLAIISIVISCIQNNIPKIKEVIVSPPYTSSEANGRQYTEVTEDYKENEFTDISYEYIDDLIIGWLTSDGEVEKVEINGTTDYTTETTYNQMDAKVVIYYHTFPIKDNTAEEDTDEEDTAEEDTEVSLEDIIETETENVEDIEVEKYNIPTISMESYKKQSYNENYPERDYSKIDELKLGLGISIQGIIKDISVDTITLDDMCGNVYLVKLTKQADLNIDDLIAVKGKIASIDNGITIEAETISYISDDIQTYSADYLLSIPNDEDCTFSENKARLELLDDTYIILTGKVVDYKKNMYSSGYTYYLDCDINPSKNVKNSGVKDEAYHIHNYNGRHDEVMINSDTKYNIGDIIKVKGRFNCDMGYEDFRRNSDGSTTYINVQFKMICYDKSYDYDTVPIERLDDANIQHNDSGEIIISCKELLEMYHTYADKTIIYNRYNDKSVLISGIVTETVDNTTYLDSYADGKNMYNYNTEMYICINDSTEHLISEKLDVHGIIKIHENYIEIIPN